MKFLKVLFFVSCFICASTSSYANQDDTQTIPITFTNNTKNTLYFTHVDGKNDTNSFRFDKENGVVTPGSTLTIYGTTSYSDDLSACVHFTDNNGHDNCLIILDRRQFYSGQSAFGMNNDYYQSQQTQTMNPTPGGHLLDISAASVTITTSK